MSIKISQREIARAANVSVSTVSKALGATGEAQRLRPGTVRRILQVAQQMGYQPNDHARALRSNRSGLIGVFFGAGHQATGRPVVAGYSASRILDGIEQALVGGGQDLLLINFTHALDDPDKLHSVLLRKRLDGLICVGIHETPEMLDAKIFAQLPLVIVDSAETPGRFASVCMGIREATCLLVDHLVSQGHRHIGYVGPLHPSASPAQRQRLLCLAEEVNHRGLPWSASHAVDSNGPHPEVPRTGNFCLQDGRIGGARLLKQNPAVTAIVAYNDLAAAGVLQCLAQCGVACPRDVSVCGYGNYDIAESVWPALTTVDYPLTQMGRTAAEWLLTQLQASRAPEAVEGAGQVMRLPGAIVVRDSVGPVRA